MADPLSISASIAGLITLADAVFLRTMRYVRSVRNAVKDIENLARQINLLGGSLHSLSRLAKSLADEPFDTTFRMDHIEACNNILSEIRAKLNKAEDKTLKQRLTWPLSSRRVKEMLAELIDHKNNIDLAMTADSMSILLRCLSKGEETLNKTSDILTEVKRTREITSRIHKDSERRRVLDSFLICNPQPSYEMTLNIRHPRTGLWLTCLPTFNTWLSIPDSKLWFSGIPGAGKTVLAGVIIQESLARNTEDVATAFFFCDYMDQRTHSPVNILGALACQLAIQKEEAYTTLEKYFYELHPSRSLERSPTVQEMAAVLDDILKLFQHVYLVIDGLDECGKFTDDVLDTLLDVTKDADNISIAILSRDESNIRDRLEEEFISEEIAAHTEDIVEYATSEIEKRVLNRRLRIDDLGLKEEILQRLIEGSNGMFRWVSCQLDHLRDCVSDQECRDALNRLPPDLKETYTRILERLPRTKSEMVQTALLFIAYSSPKLTVRQLREVLSMPERGNRLEPRAIIREDAISRLCSSLIRKSNDGEHFELAHFSVREYLESDSMLKPELQSFLISESRCKCLLALRCLQYLQLENFDHLPVADDTELDYIGERNEKYSMYGYSAVYWTTYAVGEWANEQILASAKSLFKMPKKATFVCWSIQLAYHILKNDFFLSETNQHLGDASNIRKMISMLIHQDFTPLHMAAALCLSDICSFLLSQDANVNLLSPVGSPIQCAVNYLRFALPPEFIRVTVTPEARYFELTISVTLLDTIQCLLQAGSICPAACSHQTCRGKLLSRVIIRASLHSRYLLTASTLLQAGLELNKHDLINFSDSMTRSQYHGVIGQYEKDLQKFITSLNSMIDKSPFHFELCIIAWKRSVEWGLEFASNPLFVDTRISLTEDALRAQAIAYTVNSNAEALERILDDSRIEASDIIDDEGQSLLHLALDLNASSKTLPVVQTLLKAGCSVLKQNRDGETPSHIPNWPHDCMHGGLVEDFIQRGVTCSMKDSFEWNVLHCHVASPVILEEFLKLDTEDNVAEALRAVNDRGYTPFTEALDDGNEESALLLLNRSGHNQEAWKSSLPILALAAKANAPLVFEALLDLGADASPETYGIDTPLHHIAVSASTEFVNRLKSLYPNACISRSEGKTPLDAFVWNCLCYDNHPPAIHMALIDALSEFGFHSSEVEEKSLAWESFALKIIRHARGLREHQTLPVQDQDRKEVLTSVAAHLLQLGFMESYESTVHQSGLLPLLEPSGDNIKDIDGIWPISSCTICDVVQQTQYWESICVSPLAVRLINAAIVSNDVKLVKLLVSKGINVHQRVDEFSPLETICHNSSSSDDSKFLFRLLLEHADKSRLDETNPNGDQQGLVHILARRGAGWQMYELLKNGANPNLLTGNGLRGSALLHLIYSNAIDVARILLENGADPTLVDANGVDATILAARLGRISILELLHHSETGQSWQINWQKTVNIISVGIRGKNIRIHRTNALHQSSWTGQVESLRFYLDRGIITDLNAKCDNLYTTMHLATIQGHLEVVKFLCDRHADINVRTADGELPLHLAVRFCRFEVVKVLLEAGSDMTADSSGMTPLMHAYELKDQPIIDYLCQAAGQNSAAISARLHQQGLAKVMEVAISNDNLDLCEKLQGQGCDLDIDMPGRDNITALIFAIVSRKPKIIAWLLENGTRTMGYRHYKDSDTSAFHEIIKTAELNDVLPIFLEKYRNDGGNILDESPGLVDTAVEAQNQPGLRLLLKHIEENAKHYGDMVEVDPTKYIHMVVNQRGKSNLTPLHCAAKTGQTETIKLLLQSGAEIDSLDSHRQTPLHIGIQSQNTNRGNVVRLLLRKGAALESRDDEGHTPLLLAVHEGCQDIVNVLLEAKADSHASDYFSNSCLHLYKAASSAYPAIFVILLQLGLDPHHEDTDGNSAIHNAMCDDLLASLLLNSDLQLQYTGRFPWHNFHLHSKTSWLIDKFRLYRRKLGKDSFRDIMNPEPTVGWSPLCRLAAMGLSDVIENLLSMDAHIDFEGCPSGSALMAACSASQLESVQLLVRRGASLAYHGTTGFRSAFEISRNSGRILHWLLVERFSDQRKLEPSAETDSSAQFSRVNPWSGITKAELTITGQLERRSSESSKEYWIRLMREKIERRGSIIPPQGTRRTSRPSRLIPVESVRIHPEGYEVRRNDGIGTNDVKMDQAEERLVNSEGTLTTILGNSSTSRART